MTATRPHNPFQYYLGKAVTLESRYYVVERIEVVGRELSFLLRDTVTGNTEMRPPLDIIDAFANHPTSA